MNKFTTAKNKRGALIKRKRKLNKFFKLLKYYPIVSSSIILTITIILVTCIVMAIANWELIEIKSKNNLGDAMGGIANPIIAFIGVFVTFLAFYIQYRFNREQSKLIAQQRAERIQDKKDRDLEVSKEQFDRKFYELLKIHNDNVKEFNIDNKYLGRECFPQILNELKIIYNILENNFKFTDKKETTLKSYVILFYGIDSKNVQRSFLGTPEIIKLLKNFYKDYNQYQKYISPNSKETFKENYKLDEEIILNYEPFKGHQFRLNHYFRHLFFILESVENSVFLNNNEKQEYFDIVRAQLSNYEQSLIYYNSTCLYPEEYKKYVVEYSIIKNITLEICDFGIEPNEFYKEEISLKRLAKKSFFSFVK